jgi:uncharacterized protein
VVKNANPLFRGPAWRQLLPALGIVAVIAMAGAGVGCAKEKSAGVPAKATTSAPKTAGDHFSIKVGDQVVRMQLAVRPNEMQRGLMERRNLGSDEGMIFVYERPQQMSFWMHNTPTPLDIGFFGHEGTLQEVYPLHPFDETSVTSRGSDLQFALEVNQGWFREKAVKPGAKLDLRALAAALKERGFEPRKFGLE